MSAGKNFLLVFVSVLLVLSLFSLGILWSFHIFIYPQVYEKALAESGAYNSINLTDVPGGSFIKIPNGGIPALVDGLLENTLSYLRGDSSTLNLTLEVDSGKLNKFFLDSASNFRICSPGENPFNASEPNCRPSDINASDYLNQVLEKKNFTIPDGGKVNLADVFGLKNSDTAKIRNYVVNYQYLMYGIFFLVLIFSVLIFFISDSRTRWSGIDFFLSGVLVFLISSLISSFAFNAVLKEIGFVQKIAGELIGVFLSRLKTYSFVVGGIGIIGFVLSFFIKKKLPEEKKKNKKV